MGLGNPGDAYATTRHNAGFLLADALIEAWGFPRFVRPWRWRARVSDGMVGDERVVVVKPQTYMNRSGTALGRLLDDDAFDPARDLLVVVDEAALPLGTLRIRPRGSDGGHNGLKSIAGRLQSHEYARLRIGVGPLPEDADRADWVLSDFSADEQRVLDDLMPTLTETVTCWIEHGIETAMNRYNRRGTQSE